MRLQMERSDWIGAPGARSNPTGWLFMLPEAFDENPAYSMHFLIDIFSFGGVVLFVGNHAEMA